jgi:hypothetical protein
MEYGAVVVISRVYTVIRFRIFVHLAAWKLAHILFCCCLLTLLVLLISTRFSCPPGVPSLLQKTFVRVTRFLGADEIAARCYENMQHCSSDTRTC